MDMLIPLCSGTSFPLSLVFFSISDGIEICPCVGNQSLIAANSPPEMLPRVPQLLFSEGSHFHLCAVCLFVLDKIVKSLAQILLLACLDCLLY